MNFLVLSPDYPDDRRSSFPFVRQLVDELAKLGHNIQVVAPYSLTHNKRLIKQEGSYKCGKGVVTVYRPYYLSFSNYKIAGYSPNAWFLRMAYKKGLKMIKGVPDVVYGHFWSTAYHGFEYAQKHNLPLFVATGESNIEFRCDSPQKKAFCDYVSGVICVSSKNRDESIELGLTVPDKCVVIPNAINSNIFKELDKSECRKQLGYPEDAFIVSFVGWFRERKGARRVSEAISRINEGNSVYSIFIGEGDEEPDCSNILYKGKLSHEDIPMYLNAADVFVLPTLREGCCNAIIEAMACGLPVISSNLPFNADVLNASNSILINPMDIDGIKGAIVKLRDDKNERDIMTARALESAAQLTLDKRALRIVSFINENSWNNKYA